MANGSIARRYARALVALGQETSKVEALGSDLTAFSGVLDLGEVQGDLAHMGIPRKGNPGQTVSETKELPFVSTQGQLRAALTNPGLTIVERKAVLDQVLAKMSLDKDTANFLRLLVDKNRFDIFDGIQRSYSEMADDIAGRARATVTTATKLTAAMQKTVQKALEESTGKTVEIDFTVDSGLIGGMVAQVGDISYDASVRTRLDNLQFALTRNPGAAAEA